VSETDWTRIAEIVTGVATVVALSVVARRLTFVSSQLGQAPPGESAASNSTAVDASGGFAATMFH